MEWRLVLGGAAAIALGGGSILAVWLFGHALMLIVLAATLASALQPLVCRLDRWLPRSLAAIAVYLAIAAAICAVGIWVAPSLTGRLQQLFSGARLEQMGDSLAEWLPVSAGMLESMSRGLGPRLMAAWSSAATGIVDVVAVVFLSLYLLLASPALHQFILRLTPHRQRRRVDRGVMLVAWEMGGYFRGAAINGVIVAGITWAGLLLAGVELAPGLALLAGFGELIPYVGPILAGIPAVAIALSSSTRLAVIVVVMYVAIQQIEGHVLTPLIMHRQTNVSPPLVIAALLIGYAGGGIVGALSAIPLFAAARVAIVHEIAPALRRRTLRHGRGRVDHDAASWTR